MNGLEIGMEVPVEDGGYARIEQELGRGGQGIVYQALYRGKSYALKWYFYPRMKDAQKFRGNLKNNIKDKAPNQSGKFLWPLYLTQMYEGSFGYLMELAPKEYESFVDIYNGYRWEKPAKGGRPHKIEVKFASLDAMVTAAINIVKAFRDLHLAGKSYQDLNDGCFFIHVETGDVLVCDCDNVAPDNENYGGIGGFPGFMAPEIVKGVGKPNVTTDRYSLAVVLFRLFFRGDPLEGRKVHESVVLTEAKDLKHYGLDPVFVYDPIDERNRPVRGIHDNVLGKWPIYPQYIRNLFIQVFTEGMKQPGRRVIEKKWMMELIRLRADIIRCGCGRVSFSTTFKHQEHFTYHCQACGQDIYSIQIKNMVIPLYPGLALYQCYMDTGEKGEDFETVTGRVVENKNRKGMFGIKNLSGQTWVALFPDQQEKEVKPGGAAPIWKGLKIDFGTGVGAKVLW